MIRVSIFSAEGFFPGGGGVQLDLKKIYKYNARVYKKILVKLKDGKGRGAVFLIATSYIKFNVWTGLGSRWRVDMMHNNGCNICYTVFAINF